MNRQQQKFYWAAILPAAREGLGKIDSLVYDCEELHERFKLLFLGRDCDRATGEQLERPRSTMSLNQDETHDYFEAIKSHLAQFGISFPNQDQHRLGAA